MPANLNIGGGLDTVRVPAAGSLAVELARERRDAKALAYLRGRGADDVAVILGLLPDPLSRRRHSAFARPALDPRRCPICDDEFIPTTLHQRACGRSCGSRLSARTRREEAEAF